MSDIVDRLLCRMTPGLVAAGIVEGSVAHVIASTWKYGNCYTNSIEIAVALGLNPAAPADEIVRLRNQLDAARTGKALLALEAERELCDQLAEALQLGGFLTVAEAEQRLAALAAYEAARKEADRG